MTGYSIVESVFDAREMIEASGALAAASLPRTKAGIRHVLRLPAIRALAARPELLSLAANVLGSDPVPFRATLFDKSASANWLVTWHQDIALPLARRVDDPTWGPWSIKGGVMRSRRPPRSSKSSRCAFISTTPLTRMARSAYFRERTSVGFSPTSRFNT
jgi:hypothetical protein